MTNTTIAPQVRVPLETVLRQARHVFARPPGARGRRLAVAAVMVAVAAIATIAASASRAYGASVEGRIANCGEAAAGHTVVVMTRVTIGIPFGIDGFLGFCRPVPAFVTEVASTVTDAAGRFFATYTAPSEPPGACSYSARVYLRVYEPGESSAAWVSPTRDITDPSSAATIDFHGCPAWQQAAAPIGVGPYDWAAVEVDDIPISPEIDFPDAGVAWPGPGGSTDVYYEPATGTNRAKIYYPANDDGSVVGGSSLPVIVYGHGMRGRGDGAPSDNTHDNEQLSAILSYLASWGFVVVAPDLSWLTPSLPGGAAANYPARMRLMRDAIDYMLADNCRAGSRFQGRIDRTRIGAMGHSMAAIGSVLLGAQDKRVRAVALLGPAFSEPLMYSVADYDWPLLIVYGSEDPFANEIIIGEGVSFLGSPRKIYDHAPGVKYLTRIGGGNHFGFTNNIVLPPPPLGYGDNPMASGMTQTNQRRIAMAYVAAFFKRHLQCNDAGGAMDFILNGSTSIDVSTAVEDHDLTGAPFVIEGCELPVARCTECGPVALTLTPGTGEISPEIALPGQYFNGSDTNVVFTATMRSNMFFGAEHVVHSEAVAAHTGIGFAPVPSITLPSAAPGGQDRVRIDVTTNATGGVLVGTCEYDVMVLASPPWRDIVVSPIDTILGDQPVRARFEELLAAGLTTLTTRPKKLPTPPPPPPAGLAYYGDPPLLFELATAAKHAGAIEVCVDLGTQRFSAPQARGLFHFEDLDQDGIPETWVNRTWSRDWARGELCGRVESFSLFAVFQRQPATPLAAFNVASFVHKTDGNAWGWEQEYTKVTGTFQWAPVSTSSDDGATDVTDATATTLPTAVTLLINGRPYAVAADAWEVKDTGYYSHVYEDDVEFWKLTVSTKGTLSFYRWSHRWTDLVTADDAVVEFVAGPQLAAQTLLTQDSVESAYRETRWYPNSY